LNRKKAFFTILLLFSIISTGNAQKVRFTVNTSHMGSVSAFAYHSDDLLFSGGTDGTIKIWNIKDKKLHYDIQISPFPILTITLHPQKTEMLVLTKDNVNTYIIIAKNWKTGHTLYTIPLNSPCLYLDYSPQGTYFFSCTSHWDGFAVFNALTGERLSFLPDSLGIVSYAVISRKEKNIMTYNPSGKIIYWNIAKSQIIKELTTLADIRFPFITEDKSYLIGYCKDTLVVIDLLSGSLKAYFKLPHIIDLSYNSTTQEIAYISQYKKDQKIGFIVFHSDNLSLSAHSAVKNIFNATLTKIVFADRLLFAGNESGNILCFKDHTYFEQFAQNNLHPISDLAVFNGSLALTASTHIIFFSSQLISGEIDFPYPRLHNESFTMQKLTLPFANAFLETASSKDSLLIAWQNEKRDARYTTINPIIPALVQHYSYSKKTIVYFSLCRYFLHIVDKSGQLLLISRNTFKPVFRYSAYGMNAFTVLSDDELIFGRNRGTQAGSALMRINFKNGKISAVPTSAQAILHIIKSPFDNLIYTVGFEEIDNTFYTVIEERRGDNFEQSKHIYKLPGEYYQTRMKFALNNKTIYFTLSGDTLYTWNGTEVLLFSNELCNIKEFTITDDCLYVLHKNSLISVWHTIKKKKLFELCLLRDYSWIITVYNGQYFTSEKGMSYLNIFKK
jgi:hypothetical protein